MAYYVCKGAKLKCSMGSDQSDLDVFHPAKAVNLCGKPMAGIMDSKPMINIKPFGKCKSLANPVVAAATAANYGRLQEMPCVPNTASPWLNGKMNLIIKGSPALLDTSKCLCAWAGVIEITDAGQNTVKEGGPMNVSIRTDSPSDVPAQQTASNNGNSFAPQSLVPRNAATNMAPLGIASSNSLASQSTGTDGAASATRLLIRSVVGDSKATPGGKADYWVTEYSRSTGEVSPQDRFRIRWAVKVDGGIRELTGRNGDSLALDIKNEWANKEIVVMACVEGFNEKVSQRTMVGRAEAGTGARAGTLVRGVKAEGDKNGTAYFGQAITYKVTSYNKDKNSVGEEEKKRVKWRVKIGEKLEEQNEKGDSIEITMKEEWVGQKIIVMPYFNSPTEDVSQMTRVIACQHKEGAIAVAEYIVNEIKTNTKSNEAKSIRYYASYEEYEKRVEEWRKKKLIGRLLTTPDPPNLVMAKALWVERVASNRPWDHKPKIKDKFAHLAVERIEPSKETKKDVIYKSYHHKYKDYDYYYDVWSNIHYGYVGLSVGFDEQTLLDGADLAQIIDSRGKDSQDTKDDKTSIKIGFALYKKYGQYAERLTASDVLEALVAADIASMTNSKKVHVCLKK